MKNSLFWPRFVVWKMAMKYIISKRHKRLPSMIATLSFCGIFLSVAILVVTMSVMHGFRVSLIEKIVGFGSHISIGGESKDSLSNYDKIQKDISLIKNVESVCSVIEGHGMLISNVTKESLGIMVEGISAVDFGLKSFERKSGNCSESGFGEDNIILTTQIASRLGVNIGDKVTVIIPDFSETIFGMIPRKKVFTVSCLVKIGMYQYDETYVFMPFSIASKFYRTSDMPTTIEIRLKNPEDSTMTLKDIRRLVIASGSQGIFLSDWKSVNETMIHALLIEKIVMFMMLSLLVAVATFTIFSNLVLMVSEKSKNIAVLRSMGMSSFEVGQSFFLSGFMISLTGTITGAIVGMLFSYNIQKIKSFLESTFGWDLFNPAVYFLSNLPSKTEVSDIVAIVLLSILLAIIASVIPAIRASYKRPSDILREF